MKMTCSFPLKDDLGVVSRTCGLTAPYTHQGVPVCAAHLHYLVREGKKAKRA